MDGIEKITEKIAADAQAEVDAVLNEARAQAADIIAGHEAKGRAEAEAVLAKGRRAAADREERLVSLTQLECRKAQLEAKQEMIGEAFRMAEEKLTSLPQEEYAALLASLAARASSTGREELIFSPEDRETVGLQVAAEANAILAKQAAPELPQEVTATKAGALLDKVVTGAAGLLTGAALLTVSKETRPMSGGFILREGDVEVSCTFDTLIRLQREKLAGQVAAVLFN